MIIRGSQVPTLQDSAKCIAILTASEKINKKTAEPCPYSSSFVSSPKFSKLADPTRREILKIIYPAKLDVHNEVRVIAPSRSLHIISAETRTIADQRLSELKLKVSLAKHVEEVDDFCSSSVLSRIEDLHNAFRDSSVNAIFTAIGGFNSNQLLDYIDWEIIRQNPKIFCGFSDITVLNNAIFAKTGLVTYYGPHYSTFGQKLHFDYTLEYAMQALGRGDPFEIKPSPAWSDDEWYKNQQCRTLIENPGFLAINEGECDGRILGGNLSAFASLKGTPYFPDLTDSIIFLEDDEESQPHHFDRLLQSLIQLPDFQGVKGIVIGRFQKVSKMTDDLLTQIIKSKKALDVIPVLANVDFGHTDPKATLPIGANAHLKVSKDGSILLINKH